MNAAVLGPGGFAALLKQAWLAVALSANHDHHGDGPPDAALIEQARQGDPRALQAIYQRYAAPVFRRLTHLLGADPEREDLMQESFADLFRQLNHYRGEAALRTYLFRIVANKACDHLRRRGRVPTHPTADRPEPRESEIGSGYASPEDRVGARQELALVWLALDRLSPKKRIAYLLRVVEGLSLKEIADQVGATVFTVAQRIRHADREIHRSIEQKP